MARMARMAFAFDAGNAGRSSPGDRWIARLIAVMQTSCRRRVLGRGATRAEPMKRTGRLTAGPGARRSEYSLYPLVELLEGRVVMAAGIASGIVPWQLPHVG